LSQARRRVIPLAHSPRRECERGRPRISSPPGGSLSPLGLGPRSHASPQGLTLAGEVNSWVRVTRRVADSPARRGHLGGSPGPLPRALRLFSQRAMPLGSPPEVGACLSQPRACPPPPAPRSVGRGCRGEGPRRPRGHMHSKLRIQESPHLAPTFRKTPLGPSLGRFTLHEARSRLS